ncbi:aldehyde dehydrogenase family protein [Streptomyces sp. CA-210063]|uniref:aldehyde dehydrogenase family protein n=1 Tax=Streptomyces sp. CA-210063 TaxID=2801029 RepID=UPI00214BCDA5|nr:aldehyde dehydrogenase family protein [Streptomyces sp. CA-210063]UUU36529.1 aldehyde dehydrogenase family protein [Streptomyces sp. CA-210063]
MRPSPYERHRELLQEVVRALAAGECRRPFTEATGQDAADAGMRSTRTAGKVFGSLLGRPFDLDQPGELGRVATESSPYGIGTQGMGTQGMGIGYPRCDPAALVAAAGRATAGWRAAGLYQRAGLAVEILRRLNTRSHELALAVQHTTGQPPEAAFRAAGPRAQDRALEAVAHAFAESARVPADLRWESASPRGLSSAMRGTCTLVPRGVSLLIGCPDYPLWNGCPGLFASLVTGNPVIVAPHPRSVLPLAITVRVARQVLAEAGHTPDIVSLAVAEPGERLRLHQRLATDPAVRIVDFTGSARFADWLEQHARQATVFAERTGLNTVVVDSTEDYRGLMRGLAHSLCLCSGTVRTTPQNILVPTTGIATDEGRKSLRDFGADLGEAVDRLLGHPARVARLLGAIASEEARAGLAQAARYGAVLHPSRPLSHPDRPGADLRSPLLVRLGARDGRIYAREWPGPVSFLVGTDSTSHSLALFRGTVGRRGALYAAVHSTDPLVLAVAETAALDAGVHLVQNLAGDFPADPSSAGADLPATGAHFVTGRFRVVRSRRHAVTAAPAPAAGQAPVPVAIPALAPMAEPARVTVPDAGSSIELLDV